MLAHTIKAAPSFQIVDKKTHTQREKGNALSPLASDMGPSFVFKTGDLVLGRKLATDDEWVEVEDDEVEMQRPYGQYDCVYVLVVDPPFQPTTVSEADRVYCLSHDGNDRVRCEPISTVFRRHAVLEMRALKSSLHVTQTRLCKLWSSSQMRFVARRRSHCLLAWLGCIEQPASGGDLTAEFIAWVLDDLELIDMGMREQWSCADFKDFCAENVTWGDRTHVDSLPHSDAAH